MQGCFIVGDWACFWDPGLVLMVLGIGESSFLKGSWKKPPFEILIHPCALKLPYPPAGQEVTCSSRRLSCRTASCLLNLVLLTRGERERERDRSIAEMKGSLLPAGFELNTSMNSQKQDLQ